MKTNSLPHFCCHLLCWLASPDAVPEGLSAPDWPGNAATWLRLRTTCAIRLLPLVLLLALPAVVQAQYTVTTNNGTITITGYTGTSASVTIPNIINGLPVTAIGSSYPGVFQNNTTLRSVTIPNSIASIGDAAFYSCTSLTNVTIPDSVTHIGDSVFAHCDSLRSVTIGNGVTSIANDAFFYCIKLASITIPNSVTSIGYSAFQACSSLTSVMIPNSVSYIDFQAFSGCSLTSVTIPNSVSYIGDSAFNGCSSLTNVSIGNGVTGIGNNAFAHCTGLTGVYFQGNAPSFGVYFPVFSVDDSATVYYLPGTTGWGPTFSGAPTALWSLPNPLILTSGPGFGVQSNGFGFIISWATNIDVVVEASIDLANPIWSPVGTNTLTDGSSYFSDPEWTNYPARFYRLRSP